MEDHKEVVLDRMNRNATKQNEISIIDSYKETIQMIATTSLPWKEICITLAKEHPDLFIKLTKQIGNSPTEQYTYKGVAVKLTDEELKEIDNLIVTGQKIAAIRAFRQVTEQGLLESKHWIEGRAEDLTGAKKDE